MTKDTEQLAPKEHQVEPVKTVAEPSPFATKAMLPHKRTLGEKTVDFIVYPFVNNFLVIGTSVVATYLTKHGDTVGKEGGALRKMSSALKRRGDWMQGVFQNHLGMNEKSADMGKMVFFSFADGTALTPFVKLLEDRREEMARWVDKRFGDKNADDLVYKTEPKQTWGSVISGRIASLAIVLPTAIALNQKVAGKPINDHIFDVPSEKLAEKLEAHTNIKSRFPNLNTQFFSKTLIFEAVYTSICTTGLYFISRHLVKKSKTHQERVQEATTGHQQHSLPMTQIKAPQQDQSTDTPAPHVSETTHLARLAAPAAAQEITA